MPSLKRLALAGGSLCLFATATWACGPFFPSLLLENRAATLKAAPFDSFAFEISHLVPRPDSVLQPVEPTPGVMDGRQERYNRAESEGLTIDQVEEIEMMRSSQSVADADPIGHDLPAAIRLYTDGAVAYHLGDFTAASKNFQAVLDLPPAEGAPRSIWALYMLGRIAAQSDDDRVASEDFDQLRDRVLKGAPDPLGLAVASIGDQAKPLFDRAVQRIAKGALQDGSPDSQAFAHDMAGAVALYARQAAYGSTIAADSLLEASQILLSTHNGLAVTLADPTIQRVLVAYVMANAPETEDADAAEPDPQLVAVLGAIEKAGLDHVAGADRVAALAYRLGRFDLAAALADKAPGPLADWIKAKLLIQKGDLAAAATLYASVIHALPAQSTRSSVALGEAGTLALARGEYLQALELLYRSGDEHWGDTAYVAERVLTTQELKNFVDAEVPDEGRRPVANPNDTPQESLAEQLRDLLARRLVRDGDISTALPYFYDTKTRQQAADYKTALDAASHSWFSTDRAAGWYQAAVLARESGMEIMGTETAPDESIHGGDFDEDVGKTPPSGPFVTDGEIKRSADQRTQPDLRFHYRYIAVDEASKAADLLPPRSQAFAATLCAATGWMRQTSGAEDRATALYQRYVHAGAVVPFARNFGRDCPEPEFEEARFFPEWAVVRKANGIARRHAWPLGAGAVLVVAGIALVVVRRRRFRTPPPSVQP
jgi:tetratricopeptide (TPR) repeat protein